MANRESVDAVRSEKRRKRAEIGSLEKSATVRGNIEGERQPNLDELRNLRADIYSGGSPRRSAAPSRMVSAAVSRSSLTGSKSVSSRRRVKRSSSNRVDGDAKPRRKKRSNSNNSDPPQIYVYGAPPVVKERPSSRIRSETRTLGRDDESCDSNEDMDGLPVVSEEPEVIPKKRKIRIVYVDEDKPRLSRHSSRRVVAEDHPSTKDKVKVSEKSLHRSNTTSTRRSSIIPPLSSLKR